MIKAKCLLLFFLIFISSCAVSENEAVKLKLQSRAKELGFPIEVVSVKEKEKKLFIKLKLDSINSINETVDNFKVSYLSYCLCDLEYSKIKINLITIGSKTESNFETTPNRLLEANNKYINSTRLKLFVENILFKSPVKVLKTISDSFSMFIFSMRDTKYKNLNFIDTSLLFLKDCNDEFGRFIYAWYGFNDVFVSDGYHPEFSKGFRKSTFETIESIYFLCGVKALPEIKYNR